MHQRHYREAEGISLLGVDLSEAALAGEQWDFGSAVFLGRLLVIADGDLVAKVGSACVAWWALAS